jgi:hypothetical protein
MSNNYWDAKFEIEPGTEILHEYPPIGWAFGDPTEIPLTFYIESISPEGRISDDAESVPFEVEAWHEQIGRDIAKLCRHACLSELALLRRLRIDPSSCPSGLCEAALMFAAREFPAFRYDEAYQREHVRPGKKPTRLNALGGALLFESMLLQTLSRSEGAPRPLTEPRLAQIQEYFDKTGVRPETIRKLKAEVIDAARAVAERKATNFQRMFLDRSLPLFIRLNQLPCAPVHCLVFFLQQQAPVARP